MLAAGNFKIAKIHIGLMNVPLGNRKINFSSYNDELNISTGFFKYLEEINQNNINFKHALNNFKSLDNPKMSLYRGIFDSNYNRDIITIILLSVLAIIIIMFTVYCRKYRMNVCFRHEFHR